MDGNGVNLSNIAGGSAEVLFQAELNKIIENIKDKRTNTNDKRKIILEIVITPDVKREVGNLSVSSKCRLAGFDKIKGEIFISGEDGKYEVSNEDIRQYEFEDMTFEKGSA